MKNLEHRPAAYVYSVIRAMPNPRRGESVNLGVILVAPDGHFSDARFGSVARVRKLDSGADVDSIKLFLRGISETLPLHGSQMHLGSTEGTLDASTLLAWSKEFGGSIRISEPRSLLATDPTKVLDQLFLDYVAPPEFPQPDVAAEPQQRSTRASLLNSFDRSVSQWGNAQLMNRSGMTVRGYRAKHLVDRVLELQPSVPVAVIEAISFASRDLAELYGRRATICLAAEDLNHNPGGRRIAAFAVHSDAPHNRLEALQESAELFRNKGVTPILIGDLEPIRRAVGGGLKLR